MLWKYKQRLIKLWNEHHDARFDWLYLDNYLSPFKARFSKLDNRRDLWVNQIEIREIIKYQ